MSKRQEALSLMRNARATLNEHIQEAPVSREVSFAVTNLDQAIQWLEQDIQARLPKAHPG